MNTSEKINILIVEDESIVALDLSMGLQKEGYHVVGTADNANDALTLFKENEVDIMLMDIHIYGDKDGIDTTLELLKIKQVPVIYLTAYSDDETISRVKKIHAAAFLTKPYSINNVRIAIELAISNFAVSQSQAPSASKVIHLKETPPAENPAPAKEPVLQLQDFIFIRHNYNFIKLRLEDLLFIETENNYISLVLPEKKYLLRLSLNTFLDKISFEKLIRIHRSYAVNIDHVKSFNEQSVIIEDIELPIGRNYKDHFLGRFYFG